jgi:hypothetical protein
MNKNNLKDLKVLVANIHAYGNVGDHLETAPLLYKLREFGVGTIHAHITKYSQAMGESYDVKIPAVAGKPYLCEPYVDKILYDIPESPIYDFIIHAPGPCVCAGHGVATKQPAFNIFPQEYFNKCKFIYFGMTYDNGGIKWLKQQISTNTRKIAGIFSREPFSHEDIKSMLNDITVKQPNTTLPEILMSEDISFSLEISTDMKLANEYYHKFKKEYGENYDLVILRSSKRQPFNYKADGPGFVIRNDKSDLEVVTTSGKYKLKANTIVATTDVVTDGLLMNKSKKTLGDVPHVMCQTVEELYGLVKGASCVYSNRYHGCIMAVHQNKPFIALDHWETSKMEGVKLLSAGKTDGTYTGDNDEAWELLNCILQDNS